MTSPPPHPAPVRRSRQEIEERARAAFLGLAVGDALGATTEFMTAHEIEVKYGVHKKMIGGGWLALKPGQVTDDTEMSVHLARAVLDAGGWDLKAIAESFVAWMRNKPVDIGATCARGIRTYIHMGTLEMPANEWDAGNGAVMRMAPAALFSLGDETLLEACAVQQARLTHNHPLSDAACIIIGRMVQQAILGATPDHLRSLADEFVRRHPKFRFRPYLGNSSAYVVDTLQTVFHHLDASASFEDALVGVVNQGGDADTTGAIAGMVAGALYGLSDIPKPWLKHLNPSVRSEVEELAVRLVRKSPLGRAG